jgi:flavin-dependent dehydrogenase
MITTHTSPASTNADRVEQVDVVVVGARCAGAATAMLLAERGVDVLVLDRAEFPSDTLSTHAIARTGVVQLHRWGLLDEVLDSGAPALRQVEFHSPDGTIRRTIKDRHGVDLLVAPRRHVLDPILQSAASRSGARIVTGVTVDATRHDALGRATGVEAHDADGRRLTVEARLVVGADGLRSRVARSVGARMVEQHHSSGAAHYIHVEGDWPAMEYHLGDRAFAGVFPTHGGAACIWVCSPAEMALEHRRSHPTVDGAFDAMLRATSPELVDRIDPTARRSTARGMIGLPNHLRAAVGPGWALVGDAGYHRDATTGHGISDAFRDAELLADAAAAVLCDGIDESTALADYELRRNELLREIFDITCEMSAFPTSSRFVELQKQLSDAIDAQAGLLAARPAPLVLTPA